MEEIYTIKLDMYQVSAIAGLFLLFGMKIKKVLPIFNKFCIPAPVIGGIIFAILHCIFRTLGFFTIEADMTLKNVFMIAFFCSVGFTASFKILGKCGKYTIILLMLSIILVIFQNVIGTTLAYAFNKLGFEFNMYFGLCLGSISLVGGHGTSGSFGPLLEETCGALGASTVAIATATYGLVAGNFLGGPLANSLILKHNLKSNEKNELTTLKVKKNIDEAKTLEALLMLVVAIGFGAYVSNFLGKFITLPHYIGAMIVGVIIRNIFDATNKDIPMNEIENFGNLSLQIFLSLAMIDLKLWQLVNLAMPMIIILSIQTIFMGLYAYLVAFNVLGKNYDAAVMTSALCGYGMGATPNAMVNMQAVTEKFGPSKISFMAVPIVGGMFIDFANAIIITSFIEFIKNVLY